MNWAAGVVAADGVPATGVMTPLGVVTGVTVDAPWEAYAEDEETALLSAAEEEEEEEAEAEEEAAALLTAALDKLGAAVTLGLAYEAAADEDDEDAAAVGVASGP